MDKVWITWVNYCGDHELQKVFDTKEKADACVEAANKVEESAIETKALFYVEEHEVM